MLTFLKISLTLQDIQTHSDHLIVMESGRSCSSLHATVQATQNPATRGHARTCLSCPAGGLRALRKIGWTPKLIPDQPPQVQKDLLNPPKVWPIALRLPALSCRQCVDPATSLTNLALHHHLLLVHTSSLPSCLALTISDRTQP